MSSFFLFLGKFELFSDFLEVREGMRTHPNPPKPPVPLKEAPPGVAKLTNTLFIMFIIVL